MQTFQTLLVAGRRLTVAARQVVRGIDIVDVRRFSASYTQIVRRIFYVDKRKYEFRKIRLTHNRRRRKPFDKRCIFVDIAHVDRRIDRKRIAFG